MSRLLTSFWSGAGRVLDLYGINTHIDYMRIRSKRDKRSDDQKLAGDMEKVAGDLYAVLNRSDSGNSNARVR